MKTTLWPLFSLCWALSAQVSATGYVGSAACKSCHPIVYERWSKTRMANRESLEFKCTKTEEPRPVSLPVSALAALDSHRKVQDEFRRQFGPESLGGRIVR